MKKAKNGLMLVLGIFDEWLTRAAGIVFVAIVGIVAFNLRTDIAQSYPVLAAIIYGTVPVLFIAGGVIFVLAIMKFSRDGRNNGTTE